MNSSKQQAIELAWVKEIGKEMFEDFKTCVNENGYLKHFASSNDYVSEIITFLPKMNVLNFEFIDNDMYSKNSIISFRPLSLKGIENNRGWIKIESEKDLPSNEDTYHIMHIDNPKESIKAPFNKDSYTIAIWLKYHTHYAPIEKRQPPIF